MAPIPGTGWTRSGGTRRPAAHPIWPHESRRVEGGPSLGKFLTRDMERPVVSNRLGWDKTDRTGAGSRIGNGTLASGTGTGTSRGGASVVWQSRLGDPGDGRRKALRPIRFDWVAGVRSRRT